ncbi:MAG: VWA domain-containing protein [Terriglobales bacterium]
MRAMLLALLAGGMAAAQAAPQIRVSVAPYALTPTVLQAQSSLVPVEVVVRRPDGSMVAGLTRANFRVLNEGKPEVLTQFSRVNRGAGTRGQAGAPAAPSNPEAAGTAGVEPRVVALWFDDVNTGDGDLKHARNAALEFLRHGLEPGDRIGLFTTSGTGQVAFTADTAALEGAIAEIRAHPRQSEFGTASCPRITPFQAYQISVLHYPEAVSAAMAEFAACSGVSFNVRTGPMIGSEMPPNIIAQADSTWNLTVTVSENTQDDIRSVLDALATQPGKRVLLLASGGFLTETLETRQEQLINEALHDKVVINALEARGLYTVDPSQPLSNPSEVGVLPLITFFYQQQSNLNAQGS